MRSTVTETLIAAYTFMLPLYAAQLLFAIHEPKKKRFSLRFLAGAVCYLSLGLFITAFVEAGIFKKEGVAIYLLAFFASYTMIGACFQMPQMEVIFVTTCGYALQHMGVCVAAVCLYGLEQAGFRNIPEKLFETGVQCVLLTLAYILVIRKNKWKGKYPRRDPRMIAIAIIILFSCLYLNSKCYGLAEKLGGEVYIFSGVICKIYGMICCSMAIYLEYTVSYMEYMKKQQEFMEQLIKTQGSQLQMSQESVSIINRKCHDIKYQLRALQFMQNESQRQEQIGEIQKAISIYDSVYHTGNEALNLLLREKTLLCEEYEIQFSCMADGSCLSFIAADDLYVLLGNALDNAIESVLKEDDREKRVISLFIGIKKGMKCIHLENYCKEPVVFQDDLPVTSKKDRAFHGFGMQSMKFLARKYHGVMDVKYCNQMFYLNFLFTDPA